MFKHLTLIFLIILALSWASSASASFIVKAPPYLGLNSGLVGFWSFDGKDTHDVDGYIVTEDKSGNNNHASSTGTTKPKRTVGRIGQALEFDGVDDELILDGLTDFDLSQEGQVSISAWLYPVDNLSNRGIFSRGRLNVAASDVVYSLAMNGSDWFATVSDGTDSITSNLNDSVDLNTWQHVLMTFDGTTVGLYKNGELIFSNEGSFTALWDGDSDADRLTSIGAQGNSSGARFPGVVDEMRVYNRALSADEIKRLYRIGATLKVNAPKYTDTLADGLVGFWSFDGKTVFATSTGIAALDTSDNNNTGSVLNGTTRTIGKIGQALSFDGVDDYVNVGNVATYDFDGSESFTVSAWFQTSSNAVNTMIVTKITGISGEQAGYALYTQSGTIRSLVTDITTDRYQTPGTVVSDNMWHHGVLVTNRDTNRATLYVDGIVGETDDISAVNSLSNSEELIVGTQGNFNGRYFDGLIDEVRIYDRALSADEIKRLYRIGATLKVNAPKYTDTLNDGLVGFWSFDDKDMYGTNAIDRSGNNNNGTLTNGPKRAIGKIGQALEFDGVDEIVNINADPTLNDLGPMTFSAWMLPRENPATQFSKLAAKIDADESAGYWFIELDNTSPEIFALQFLKLGNSGQTVFRVSSNNAYEYNVWQHVVVTWDGSVNGSGIHIFRDSIELGYQETGSAGSLASDSSYIMNLGNRTDQTNTFDGLIDEVRIYNRVLSANEILRLYNMGR